MSDFKTIIAELEASGITLYKLSVMVGRQYGIVQRWKNGAIPKHPDGERLLKIHATHVSHETLKV